MIYVQTFSAFGFGVMAIVLSFVAHPSNVSFALPVLLIGVALSLVALFGAIVIARSGTRR
jgi:hypothetical protein